MVRDYKASEECSYGIQGGEEHLNNALKRLTDKVSFKVAEINVTKF